MSLESVYREAQSLRRAHKPEARQRAEQGLAEANAQHSQEWSWKFRLLLAAVLVDQNDPARVLEILAANPPPQTSQSQAEQAFFRGCAYLLLGKYAESEKHLQESLRLAAPLRDAELVDQINLNYSSLLALRGQFDLAEAKLREVIRSSKARNDVNMEGRALYALGYNNSRDLRNEDAVDLLSQAITVFAKSGDKLALVGATDNLGWAYLSLGALDNSLRCFENSVKIAAQINSSLDQITSLNGAAEVLMRQHNYAAAEERSQRARALAQKHGNTAWEIDSLNALATNALESKDWLGAERYNNDSRKLVQQLGDSQAAAINDVVEGKVAAGRKQYPDAERCFRKVLAARGSIDPSVLLDTQSSLAQLYAAQNRRSDADAQFRRTIAYSETQRGRLKKDENKLSYLSSLIQFYRQYISFLMENGQDKRALEVADSSRARLLAEKLIAEPKLRSAAEFQKLARDSHSVLLSYWLAPRCSYLWVITGSSVETVELPGEERLAPLVRKYQEFIEDDLGDPVAAKNQAGIALWKALIEPAAKWIPENASVILAPDGILHSLNFESLLVANEHPHYWIEDVTVRIAPSLSLLLSNRRTGHESGKAVDSLLLIGAPASSGSDLPALPHAAEEMRRVHSHFSNASALYQGVSARPAVYRSVSPGRFRMIHFATHSLPNSVSPLDSALILSPEEGVYKLYARDIAAIPLAADLVTISACKSAGAKTYLGEGQVGLAWAFLQAGANNVIAGLWNVDDAYTPGLMDALYAAIREGADPADALRSAKLAMIRSQSPGRKPYYWGPFLMFTGSYR